ncbi:MAG: CoA activase [Planctomycetota bacterium]|nr:MAG: CoA activase [Planctomycetota bacterium]
MMQELVNGGARTSHSLTAGRRKPSEDAKGLYLGIDAGSTSSDVIVFDDSRTVVFSDYRRTMGKPVATAQSQLRDLLGQIDPAAIVCAAATGAAGRFLAELIEIPFVNEVPAQAAAVGALFGNLKQCTIIEMGGQDSKLIFLSTQRGRLALKDFALNTVCAAGTGSFLDQQAQRLGIDIEGRFGELAIQSKSVPRLAGRCSVFAKSDMIHLQQQATPMCDIIAGLCLALARSLKSNLGRGREFVKPVIFTGGVAANIGVVRAFENVLGLMEGQIIVPKYHFFTGAMGAALAAKGKVMEAGRLVRCLKKIDEYLDAKNNALDEAPRRERLSKPALPVPESKVHDHLLEVSAPVDAYIGIDVGSISTNVVVMDEARRLLAKEYLMTAGNPLEAIRKGLRLIGEKVDGKVNILGAASTGSGRYLTGDFVGADVVINEITAQAAGAAIVCPQVDTIFEIGGQDSKYISLENGVVVDFEMNHACAAGTGSFLEEQAQRLSINIKDEFAQLALTSDSPIRLGERCTVFIESDLLSYQQQGATTEDLVAGLSYSIVANYLNRVVGRRRIGNHICFQGGTAFNKAVWAAFEKITGKKITVPDHHEVTGALGAASIAAEHMKQCAAGNGHAVESKFKGFDNLISTEYTVDSFTCRHCSNDCEIKRVKMPDAEPLFYGSRCDRYNLKKKTVANDREDLFDYRYRKLLEHAGLDNEGGSEHAAPTTIGIPQSLVSWQLLPLFSQFFKSLGYRVVLSDKTDKRTIRRGVECATAQTCFPVKVAYGHVAELIDKGVDYIFLPSVVSMTPVSQDTKKNQLCPYVQSFPYQVRTAFRERLKKTKILTVPLRLGEGRKQLLSTFKKLGKQLGISGRRIRGAIARAMACQERVQQTLKDKGAEVLSKLPAGEKAFVLISRPYNGCDEGLNLQLPRKLAELGMKLLPMDMLDAEGTPLSDPSLHEEVYWTYGQKILRAGELIRRDRRLFAIYLSNFSCGPDSFIQTFFKDLMSQKPCLQLELDEHSADAGVITRLEAFLESLKHYRNSQHQAPPAPPPVADTSTGKRKLYIPYMADGSYGLAAAFRAYGQDAEVMPSADESTLLYGRKYMTGKECLPCTITVGEMLSVVKQPGFDPDKAAFFMPAASGPCRMGMYHSMQKLILKYAGAQNVPVISPNQDNNFYKELMGSIESRFKSAFMKSIWTAVVGVGLLEKVLLRVRPFAKNRDQVQAVYEEALKGWVKLIEKRTGQADLCRFMESAAEKFDSVEVDRKIAKPHIGIVGEIFVRSHSFANRAVVDRLERLGAVCDLAPFTEWVYYTNCMRSRKSLRRMDWRDWLSNTLQNRFQHKIEKALAEPLEGKFGRLAEEPVEKTLDAAAAYLHDSFEGEAILSVGKMIEYHHHRIGGIVNVMPFGCMPSTIVGTQTTRISAQCDDMPILNLSFDGQDDPALTTRLEAFVEQVRQKQTCTVASLVG